MRSWRKVLNLNCSSNISACEDTEMCYQLNTRYMWKTTLSQQKHDKKQTFELVFFMTLLVDEDALRSRLLLSTRPHRGFLLGNPCSAVETVGTLLSVQCQTGRSFNGLHCQSQMLGNDKHFYLSDLLKGPRWPLCSGVGQFPSFLHIGHVLQPV